jgi:hypothetical protein
LVFQAFIGYVKQQKEMKMPKKQPIKELTTKEPLIGSDRLKTALMVVMLTKEGGGKHQRTRRRIKLERKLRPRFYFCHRQKEDGPDRYHGNPRGSEVLSRNSTQTRLTTGINKKYRPFDPHFF